MIEIEDGFIDGYWEEQAERAYEGKILGRGRDEEEEDERGSVYGEDDNFKEEEIV